MSISAMARWRVSSMILWPCWRWCCSWEVHRMCVKSFFEAAFANSFPSFHPICHQRMIAVAIIVSNVFLGSFSDSVPSFISSFCPCLLSMNQHNLLSKASLPALCFCRWCWVASRNCLNFLQYSRVFLASSLGWIMTKKWRCRITSAIGTKKVYSVLGHPPCEYSFHGSKATELGFSILRTLRAALFWRFFAFKLCQWPPGYPLLSKVTKDQARAQFVEDVHLLHSESIRTSSSSAQWKSSWSKTWKSYGNHNPTLQFQALQSSGHPNSPYYLLSALHLALFPSLAPGLFFKQLLSISFWKAFHASNPFTCSLPDTLILYLVVNGRYTDLKHRTWLQQLFQLLALETSGLWPPQTEPVLKFWSRLVSRKCPTYTHTHTRRITKPFCEIAWYTPQGAFFFCKKLSLLTPSTRRGEQLAVLAKGKLLLLWSPTVVQTLQVCKIIALMFI